VLDHHDKPKTRRNRPHVAVIMREGPDGNPVAETWEGVPVSRSRLQQWLCDGLIGRVMTAGSHILDYGLSTPPSPSACGKPSPSATAAAAGRSADAPPAGAKPTTSTRSPAGPPHSTTSPCSAPPTTTNSTTAAAGPPNCTPTANSTSHRPPASPQPPTHPDTAEPCGHPATTPTTTKTAAAPTPHPTRPTTAQQRDETTQRNGTAPDETRLVQVHTRGPAAVAVVDRGGQTAARWSQARWLAPRRVFCRRLSGWYGDSVRGAPCGGNASSSRTSYAMA
jgi:hypothetical protein